MKTKTLIPDPNTFIDFMKNPYIHEDIKLEIFTKCHEPLQKIQLEFSLRLLEKMIENIDLKETTEAYILILLTFETVSHVKKYNAVCFKKFVKDFKEAIHACKNIQTNVPYKKIAQTIGVIESALTELVSISWLAKKASECSKENKIMNKKEQIQLIQEIVKAHYRSQS